MVPIVSPWRQSNVIVKIKRCTDGLVCASHEPGFKNVATLDIAMSVLGMFGNNPMQCMGVSGIALCFELVNSAIESTVDRTGYEFSTLARDAKDISSAASMLAHIIALLSCIVSII